MNRKVICFDGEEAWVDGAVLKIAGCLRAALAARRRATFMLAGGSTPESVYRALARVERVDWSQVHFFWGDERCVPAEHPESNFRMAQQALLEPLGIAPDAPNVHRFPTEAAPHEDAAMYEQNIRLFFGLAVGEMPQFDLVLLGMGDDGHTASLFPDSEALKEAKRFAAANPLPAQDTTRLTVTFPVLNAARHVFLLVKGANKAARVAEILVGGVGIYPVQQLAPQDGELVWLLDGAAASQLPAGLCETG